MTGDGSSGRRWHKECECHLFISITLRISVGSQRVSTRLTLRATSEGNFVLIRSGQYDIFFYHLDFEQKETK